MYRRGLWRARLCRKARTKNPAARASREFQVDGRFPDSGGFFLSTPRNGKKQTILLRATDSGDHGKPDNVLAVTFQKTGEGRYAGDALIKGFVEDYADYASSERTISISGGGSYRSGIRFGSAACFGFWLHVTAAKS